MKSHLLRLATILLFLAVGGPGFAGMYKWTDADGQVHYTDSPPPEQKSEQLNPTTALPTGAEQEKVKLDNEMEEFNKRQEELQKQQEAARKAEEDKQKRAEQCAALRRNLQLYMERRRVAKEVDGQQVVIPYEERVKEIEKTQEQMKKVCD